MENGKRHHTDIVYMFPGIDKNAPTTEETKLMIATSTADDSEVGAHAKPHKIPDVKWE